MKRKRVVVLGATGSIGESAAKVARDIPERVEIVGITANSKARELAAQANELRPAAVCIVDETKLSELRANLNYEPEIFAGETGLCEIASTVASDMVLVAIVGTGGLRPALAAIEAGKDLAVASKEILVMAGEIASTTQFFNVFKVGGALVARTAAALRPLPHFSRPTFVESFSPPAAVPFGKCRPRNFRQLRWNKRSNIRLGTWGRRSRSIRPRYLIRDWK